MASKAKKSGGSGVKSGRKGGVRRAAGAVSVEDVCRALGQLAPLELAESWDNVGLLAGDRRASVRRVLLGIDLTPEVAQEAIAGRFDLVAAYHPPIFKPITRLTAQAEGAEAAVFRCVANGVAVYAVHTALDAAEGGTNDVLAGLCGVTRTEPLEYLSGVGPGQHKVVTFVPRGQMETVAEAMFAAGAGEIGEYRKCSFRLDGHGTFLGSEQSHPAVGAAGRFEKVEEVRLEVVCPSGRLAEVVAALRGAHPYEEPAFDVYPLVTQPVRGTGRQGPLERPTTLGQLARRLKQVLEAAGVQIVGPVDQRVSRAIVAVGAAGKLPVSAVRGPEDVIVTGEMRHHDALTVRRRGAGAIVLGHWTSERPVLGPLAERLGGLLRGVAVAVSEADREVFRAI